jgi:DNA-binding MarR family transcriptional regulator
MSHKALRIYVLLSTYADRSGVCWPGQKELADMSCLHPETVLDALDELEQMGLMVYLRRGERDPVTKRQLVNVYEIRGCLLRADSEADSERKHETETTNVITNDNNQFHKNHLHAPPPLTKPRREAEKAGGGGVDYGTQPQKTRTKAKTKDNSAAGTAPQNSKALPPLPPLPRGVKADAALEQEQEAAARWLVEQAITRRDGGDYHAALSLANARRYIVRFGAWKCKAAVSLAKRDPATRSLIGRTDYLLRTSVAAEAEQLETEMTRLTDLSAD